MHVWVDPSIRIGLRAVVTQVPEFDLVVRASDCHDPGVWRAGRAIASDTAIRTTTQKPPALSRKDGRLCREGWFTRFILRCSGYSLHLWIFEENFKKKDDARVEGVPELKGAPQQSRSDPNRSTDLLLRLLHRLEALLDSASLKLTAQRNNLSALLFESLELFVPP